MSRSAFTRPRPAPASRPLLILGAAVATLCAAATVAAGATPDPRLVFESIPDAQYRFNGLVGDRLRANETGWLLRAPQANPGMLAMFQVRDRKPVPQLVPWAGEFVGKYLISAIQALALSDNPELRPQVERTVAALIATQAEDGYLGPFPKAARLRGNWDLWGHYHAILALTLWHEYAGDAAALTAARRAGDLVCATYLDTGHRVAEAGDAEMNMAILTGLARLHRLTGEPRYLRMAREVEHDWEGAGDYLRAGLDGREFYRSPRPRWESLHDLQGLVELWRITGDAKYRDAFIHHWRSIRRWDRRNTGGFSSGEQATGNPYAETAIETCCTVAWMAVTTDYLRLTGDSRAADDLELATYNAGLGAQHPSGRWWTYNTPMDGVREASAHTIVFQSRAGTPELNCCSVNGPRVLGMLGEWTLLRAADGLVVNGFAPGKAVARLTDGTLVTLTVAGDYPRDPAVRLVVTPPAKGAAFTLRVRIPEWADRTDYTLKDASGSHPGRAEAGRYLELRRRWQPGDEVGLNFGLRLRAVAGAQEAVNRVSLYRGPLLLAYDQADNAFDEEALPPIDTVQLSRAQVVAREAGADTVAAAPVPPAWLRIDVPAAGGRTVRLVDFASAGRAGTHYRSWLPALTPPPAPTLTVVPADGARVGPGDLPLRWRGPRGQGAATTRLEFATNESFQPVVFGTRDLAGDRHVLPAAAYRSVLGGPAPRRIWWRAVTVGSGGETFPDSPAASFILDPKAPPLVLPPEPVTGPQGEIIVHSLRGDARPVFGEAAPGGGVVHEDGRDTDGKADLLRYPLVAWPEEDFTVAVRVRIRELPVGHTGQVFSAWNAAMDDPLRLIIDGGKLHARVEAGSSGAGTSGVAVEAGRTYAVVAVKRGGQLALYLDGRRVATTPMAPYSSTQTRLCALGGNPRYAGASEHLAARFADFSLLARAWSDAEITAFAGGR